MGNCAKNVVPGQPVQAPHANIRRHFPPKLVFVAKKLLLNAKYQKSCECYGLIWVDTKSTCTKPCFLRMRSNTAYGVVSQITISKGFRIQILTKNSGLRDRNIQCCFQTSHDKVAGHKSKNFRLTTLEFGQKQQSYVNKCSISHAHNDQDVELIFRCRFVSMIQNI